MDILDEEILSLWKVLNQCKVKYIMVGGFATNFHGFSRFTADVDLWLEDSLENRRNFREAMKIMNIGDFEVLETMEFTAGWTSLILNSGIELDLMTQLKGFEKGDFEECYRLAVKVKIEGVEVIFIHLNHLIHEKEKCGRPKDLIDLTELLKIRNSII